MVRGGALTSSAENLSAWVVNISVILWRQVWVEVFKVSVKLNFVYFWWSEEDELTSLRKRSCSGYFCISCQTAAAGTRGWNCGGCCYFQPFSKSGLYFHSEPSRTSLQFVISFSRTQRRRDVTHHDVEICCCLTTDTEVSAVVPPTDEQTGRYVSKLLLTSLSLTLLSPPGQRLWKRSGWSPPGQRLKMNSSSSEFTKD